MTTMAEPEWDADTRDLVIALEVDLELCPRCGQPAEICQDPERQFDWQAGAPVRCHATTALREAQAKVSEETNPHTDALIWPLQLRDGRANGRT
ncbi:MAG TPA: hypothetical protein VGF17_25660 [Phytomonospora sp.]